MTVKLTADASIDIDHDDLCMILTEQFCDSWTPLSFQHVTAVKQEASGRFTIFFERKAAPKKEGE